MWQKAKNQYHLLVAILANAIYSFPGKRLKVIGVTGTDGKTTTVNLIYHILSSAGKKVSMISTVGAKANGTLSPLGFHVTTPSSFQIQRFLKDAVTGKEEHYVVLEVSSHAIDQNRIWGIPFTVGVVTNITNEHLDYHKSYDEYLKTKGRLLQKANIAVLNSDDKSYGQLSSLLKNRSFLTYGLQGKTDVTEKDFPNTSSLIGTFNEYNILAAASVCKVLGIEQSVIKKAIKTFESPLGRMNTVKNSKGITVIIDYAHTPNGLTQALAALSESKKDKGRLIVLVGAEGKRDPGKREEIGYIAGKSADIVIITSVDPRGEQEEINTAILKGIAKAGGALGKNVFIQEDREKAIRMAIDVAKKGDIVALFGKGHERSMNYDGHNEIPWSDSKEVEKALV